MRAHLVATHAETLHCTEPAPPQYGGGWNPHATPVVSYPCFCCEYVGKSVEEEREHYKSWHVKEKVSNPRGYIHVCPQCRSSFSRRDTFRVHFENRHTGRRTVHRCHYCPKKPTGRGKNVFNTSEELENHILDVHHHRRGTRHLKNFQKIQSAFKGVVSSYIWVFKEPEMERKTFNLLLKNTELLETTENLITEKIIKYKSVKVGVVITAKFAQIGPENDVVLEEITLPMRTPNFHVIDDRLSEVKGELLKGISVVEARTAELADLAGSGWNLISIQSMAIEISAGMPLVRLR
jgi:hypothetical protein